MKQVDRRRFLMLTGAAWTGACAGAPRRREREDAGESANGPRIERIEVFPVRYPMTGYFKFFADASNAPGRPAVLVKVTAEDGTVGWGQSVPIAKWSYETLETATVALRAYLTPALVGLPATDLEGAHRAMDRAIAPGFSTGMPITRAGLDLALHDLIGKLSGRSLAEMWGREPLPSLPLSWTVNVQDLRDVEAVVQAGVERGYRHCNIKVGPDPAFDAALARAVRRLVPDGFLWADANGGYDEATALRAAPLLADAGVDMLEAPLRPNRIRGYQALVRQGALPILMDEGVVDPAELDEFIALRMLHGVAMKPARCGGLLSCRRQIELCERHGLVWLGSGLTDPDVSLAASLHLYAAYGLSRPAALNGPQFVSGDVLRVPLRIERGVAYPPSGPGLGVEVDEEKVRALAV